MRVPLFLYPAMITVVALLLSASAVWAQTAASNEIYVNGRKATPREMRLIGELEAIYKAKAQPGRYWYDDRTGLFGREGKGALGALRAGLRLGGPLQPDASNGDSGVFVNRRQLRQEEVRLVSRCLEVRKGYFWMDAQGNGGQEGKPPQFNLITACQQAARRAAANGTPGNRGWYGSVSGGDGVVGAIFSDGTGVTCGPDGGCVF